MSEKRKNKKSKEEIAKQFDLPERKSKIATIMKQDGQVYCICRTSDCSRFMIACDNCEEWFHGDCINVTEKESKHIRQYYCERCKEENPELQTVFRVEKIKDSGSGSHSNSDQDRRKKHSSQQLEINADGCGACTACCAPNCGNCFACQSRVGNSLMPRCEYRKCVQEQIPMQIEQQHNSERSYKRSREKQTRERMRKRKRSPTPEVFINPELEGNRQCWGPGCVKTARPQSKYCNDECGIRLATARIFQVLPNRLQENTLCTSRAEEENKKQLDQIRAKQSLVRYALTELDRRHQELDIVVENAKHTTLDPNALDNSEAYEDEQSMYCFTCGHEIHSRFAVKHMEKCFNKYESQASFGSIFKTRIEGQSMFCDFYNAASKTYCKRLRVLCPEHCKDAKVNDNDVCGCPLVNDVFTLTGEFCRAPKKKCFKHYVWEKIRRAEIDMERVRQWVKMDELLEQERQVRHQMASRSGVLNLMLHSTYNHELMEEIVRVQQKQIIAVQKQKEMLMVKKQHKPHRVQQKIENVEPTKILPQIIQKIQVPEQQIQVQQQQQIQLPNVQIILQQQQINELEKEKQLQQERYVQLQQQHRFLQQQQKQQQQQQLQQQQFQQQQQQQQQQFLQQQFQQQQQQQQQQFLQQQQQQQQYYAREQQFQQPPPQRQRQIIIQPVKTQFIRQQVITTSQVPLSVPKTSLGSPPRHYIYKGPPPN